VCRVRRAHHERGHSVETSEMGAGLSHCRLDLLESAITGKASPADRGSHCSQCGGVTIDEAILDETVLDEAASDHCRRCGELTLVGTLRDMLAADEQK
jgi:hypothetical protein